MNEQPMPTPGRQDVTPVVRKLFLETLDERNNKGIATYGRGLQTHNGRDAGVDAWEELVDLMQYLTQMRLERADLLQLVSGLRSEVDELLHLAGKPIKYGGGIG